MNEGKKKHKSQNVLRVGCLLAVALVLLSVFLGGAILSSKGVGVVGKASESTKSPVGAWELPNGTVQQYRADGTGSATTKDGSVTYFEWRLNGDKLALYLCSFADPKGNARRRVALAADRVLRGIGIMDERGSANYVVVDATSDKLTFAIDDDPAGDRQKRGDKFECTAVATDETEVRTTSDEESR